MITSYIFSALNYAVVFGCIYVIAKYIYLRHNDRKFMIIAEIPYIIFGAYIVALLSQTIIPIWNVFFINGKFSIEISTYNSRSLNLIPFKTILDYLTGANDFYGNANMVVRFVNLAGNICLFIPFGFLFPIVFKKFSKIYQTMLFGLILSVFIEGMQFFVERSTDIDDVILNCIGVFCGYICYKCYDKLHCLTDYTENIL